MNQDSDERFERHDRRRFLGFSTIAALGGLSAATPTEDAREKNFSHPENKTNSILLRDQTNERRFGFVIHGGAGVITRRNLPPAKEALYRVALTQALTAGYDILRRDGKSLDAVEAAIRILEDNPLFNAGKGAVFTSAGTNELDSSIMDGRTLKAGAVSTLKHIKNPIGLARLVMEKSPHVMLVGEGAETFARQQGITLVPQSYFRTEERWRAWRNVVAEEKKKIAAAQEGAAPVDIRPAHASDRHGTVGAVALDRAGNLAAGTSTGGMTNKRFGRVGDSPIIGAGTYADNATCAISATGDGEYFIRAVAAHDISALYQYGGMPLERAAQTVIAKIGKLGGEGGVIAIDKDGRTAMVFNSEGMYRGTIGPDGRPDIKIYKD